MQCRNRLLDGVGAHSTIPTQVTRADDTETCFQWFWKEVQWLEDHPRHATSLLLMTNPYWASNFDAFEQFGDALTQALQSATESKVEGLGFEGQIQLVFFHPQYVFRDGGERLDQCINQIVAARLPAATFGS